MGQCGQRAGGPVAGSSAGEGGDDWFELPEGVLADGVVAEAPALALLDEPIDEQSASLTRHGLRA
jgi:hypothetical protein